MFGFHYVKVYVQFFFFIFVRRGLERSTRVTCIRVILLIFVSFYLDDTPLFLVFLCLWFSQNARPARGLEALDITAIFWTLSYLFSLRQTWEIDLPKITPPVLLSTSDLFLKNAESLDRNGVQFFQF